MSHEPTGFFVVIVDGNPDVGETLTARPNGVKDKDGIDYSTTAFQWLLDGEEIVGATNQTYTPSKDDRGKWLSCKWSYTDRAGNDEIVTSKALDSFVTEPRMENLRGLYREYFGRDADGEGLVWWADKLGKMYLTHEPEDALVMVIRGFVEAASPADLAAMRTLAR